MSCKYIGRYFSTKGISSSNLPARAEPPPPAPPNQEEEDAEEDEEEDIFSLLKNHVQVPALRFREESLYLNVIILQLIRFQFLLCGRAYLFWFNPLSPRLVIFWPNLSIPRPLNGDDVNVR